MNGEYQPTSDQPMSDRPMSESMSAQRMRKAAGKDIASIVNARHPYTLIDKASASKTVVILEAIAAASITYAVARPTSLTARALCTTATAIGRAADIYTTWKAHQELEHPQCKAYGLDAYFLEKNPRTPTKKSLLAPMTIAAEFATLSMTFIVPYIGPSFLLMGLQDAASNNNAIKKIQYARKIIDDLTVLGEQQASCLAMNAYLEEAGTLKK